MLTGLTPKAQAASFAVTEQRQSFPALIEGRTYNLDSIVYRPSDNQRHPLIICSHGRNGPNPVRDANYVYGCNEICRALAAEGYAVVFIVRRGYGISDGPDLELQDTAILSGLEAAKDYKAAVEFWRQKDFVLPNKVLIMGHSQGGWAAITCTNVPIAAVLGCVNLCGGTNYRLMGSGAVTVAVQDHWVESCRTLGGSALVPSFWLYSENDLSISGPTSRRMFEAFKDAGGNATLLMLPPYGSNGHMVIQQPPLFMTELKAFFSSIGFAEVPQPPKILEQLKPRSVPISSRLHLEVSVSGSEPFSYQWFKDGLEIKDSKAPSLVIDTLSASDVGNYSVTVTNSLGSATSEAFLSIDSNPGHLRALSVRGDCGTGENVMIMGVIIAGPGEKQLVMRGLGPNLLKHAVPAALQDPSLALYQGSRVLASNDDWSDDDGHRFGPAPLDEGSKDSTLYASLGAGAYTVLVQDDQGSRGEAMIELYDTAPAEVLTHCRALSVRAQLGAGQILIPGFIIEGPSPRTILMRAVGPSLTQSGVVNAHPDPTLSLYTGSHLIAENDNWSGKDGSSEGLSPLNPGSRDAVLQVSLDPGAYSLHVRGTGSTSGIVLVEIYEAL